MAIDPLAGGNEHLGVLLPDRPNVLVAAKERSKLGRGVLVRYLRRMATSLETGRLVFLNELVERHRRRSVAPAATVQIRLLLDLEGFRLTAMPE